MKNEGFWLIGGIILLLVLGPKLGLFSIIGEGDSIAIISCGVDECGNEVESEFFIEGRKAYYVIDLNPDTIPSTQAGVGGSIIKVLKGYNTGVLPTQTSTGKGCVTPEDVLEARGLSGSELPTDLNDCGPFLWIDGIYQENIGERQEFILEPGQHLAEIFYNREEVAYNGVRGYAGNNKLKVDFFVFEVTYDCPDCETDTQCFPIECTLPDADDFLCKNYNLENGVCQLYEGGKPIDEPIDEPVPVDEIDEGEEVINVFEPVYEAFTDEPEKDNTLFILMIVIGIVAFAFIIIPKI